MLRLITTKRLKELERDINNQKALIRLYSEWIDELREELLHQESELQIWKELYEKELKKGGR